MIGRLCVRKEEVNEEETLRGGDRDRREICDEGILKA